MQVEIKLTPDEAKAATIELGGVIDSSAISGPRRMLKWIVFGLVFVVIGYLSRYFNDLFGAGTSWFYLGSVLLVAVSIIGLRIIDDLKVASFLTSGTLVEAAVYDFQESGISVDSGPMRSEIEWSAIKKLHEGNEFVLLFIDPAVAIFIPKRLPESEQIVAMAKERIAESSPAY